MIPPDDGGLALAGFTGGVDSFVDLAGIVSFPAGAGFGSSAVEDPAGLTSRDVESLVAVGPPAMDGDGW